MPDYRLYLLDGNSMILARETFKARDDEDANVTAHFIADACSDGCSAYELWCSERYIVHGSIVPPSNRLIARRFLGRLDQTRQETVLMLEETIMQSRWRVANSRRLGQMTSELRATMGAKKVS